MGVLLGILVTVLLLWTNPEPASAHYTCTYHPTDGSYACMASGHTSAHVCDDDPDGHYAFVRQLHSDGSYSIGYDVSGANGVCSGEYSVASDTIAYNICVQYEGCGSPYYRSGWGSPVW